MIRWHGGWARQRPWGDWKGRVLLGHCSLKFFLEKTTTYCPTSPNIYRQLISFEQWKLRIFVSVGRQKNTTFETMLWAKTNPRRHQFFASKKNIIINNNERKMQHHSRQTTIIPEAKLSFVFGGIPFQFTTIWSDEICLDERPQKHEMRLTCND